MEIAIFLMAFGSLILIVLFYIFVKIAQRRLRRSKYGHSFDFSMMPKQKIKPRD